MQEIIFNAAVFIIAGSVVFLFGGILVEATDRIAKRLHRNGFIVAFVLLGTLTSLSEISVAVNATIERVPQVSAGNLVGASFVIFLFLIPLLAFFGNGIALKNALSQKNLFLALVVISSPALFIWDGALTRAEGFVMVLLYSILLYYTHRSSSLQKTARALERLEGSRKELAFDLGKILLGALLIFLSGRLLVTEAVYFSNILKIPSSFIGLIVISLGTNVPELVIAFRAIQKKQKSIAFGDYVGSAAFNTITLGVLVLINGSFSLERNEFLLSSLFLGGGLMAFFIFARSKYHISRMEGILLGLIYAAFVASQVAMIAQFTPVF